MPGGISYRYVVQTFTRPRAPEQQPSPAHVSPTDEFFREKQTRAENARHRLDVFR